MLKIFSSKKRAEITQIMLTTLFGLLTVFAFIFLPVMHGISQLKDSTLFQKDCLSRDMAMLIDSIYISPSNIMAVYPAKEGGFTYNFKKNRVEVYEEMGFESYKAIYPYTGDKINTFISREIKTKNKTGVDLIFAKSGNTIFVDNKEYVKFNYNKLVCKPVEAININQKKVLLDLYDAKVGEDDPKIKAAYYIGYALYSGFKNKETTVNKIENPDLKYLRKKDEYLSEKKIIETVLEQGIDIILSLKIGGYKDESNNIKIYYSMESNKDIQNTNKELACNILNRISDIEELIISGVAVVPIEYDPILVKDKIALLIEIGNMNSQKGTDMLNNNLLLTKISEAIYNTLK